MHAPPSPWLATMAATPAATPAAPTAAAPTAAAPTAVAPTAAAPTAAAVAFELPDEAATEHLGAQLAEVARPGDVIFLHGELGAGKTSLSRGFLRHFFSDPALEVPSPSYLICFTYTDGESAAAPAAASATAAHGAAANGTAATTGQRLQTSGASRLPGVSVLHLDPYRLPVGKVASLIDLAPAFAEQICLVEWPDRLGEQLVSADTPPRLEVTLGGIGPQAQGRAVSLRAVGERWQERLSGWGMAGRVDVRLPPPAAIPPPGAGAASSCAARDEPLSLSCGDTAEEGRGIRPPGAASNWLVLGIESSCDDTGAAVVRGDGTVLAEVLASQAGVHELWGGVVPKLAQEAHSAAIDRTVEEALRRSGVTAAELSAVAVTVGPGLSLCLGVGVRKAVSLAHAHQLLLVRIHHMEAHAMVTWLPKPPPPRLQLQVGGGEKGSDVPPALLPLAPPDRPTADAAETTDAAAPNDTAAPTDVAASAVATTPASAAPATTSAAPATTSAAPTPSTALSPDGVPPFPYLTLLVSGGHNMLVLSRALGCEARSRPSDS